MSFFSALSNYLAAPVKQTLGLQLNRELADCAKDIMAIFEIPRYDHDYENVWEWVVGRNEAGLEVNISRAHDGDNGDKGDFKKPLIIRMSGSPKFLAAEKTTEYAKRLAKTLQTEIWIGDVVIPKEDDRAYYFEIEERIAP